MSQPVIYLNPPMHCDVCDNSISNEFIDGRLHGGTQWANMCPRCWTAYGCGHLGQGYGQRYQLQHVGTTNEFKHFVKVEG